MARLDRTAVAERDLGLFAVALPAPRVAEPQLRQHVQRRGIRTAIGYADLHQHVAGFGLCVLDDHVEVAAVVEDARIDDLVFLRADAAVAVLVFQMAVRIRRVRVLVEHLQVRVARRRVEVVVQLFHVFAVIAFGVRQAEQTLFQDRVVAVPQRERQAQAL